jgi:hypothetical protein
MNNLIRMKKFREEFHRLNVNFKIKLLKINRSLISIKLHNKVYANISGLINQKSLIVWKIRD